MYEHHFGLKEKPFSLTPDPRFLFLSAQHRGALDHLLYGITRREGFLAITGDIGTGKTTICRALLERLDPGIRTALILNPLLEEKEVLEAILQDFGIPYPPGAGRKELIDCLNGFLLGQASRSGGAVLIIDEAQNLSVPVLEQIRILSNIETHREKLLQIILLGQRELRDKLESPSLRQLNQRISIRYHLSPLGRDETARYIEHRLTVAGASGGIEFTPGAYEAIYRYADGVPRLVNLLADRALLAGYVAGSSNITKEMVLEGHRSLAGEGNGSRTMLRPGMFRHLRVSLPAVGLAFLCGVLSVGFLQSLSGGSGTWLRDVGARLIAPLTELREVAGLPARGGGSDLGLPVFDPDPAFPYTIRALPYQEGEALRATVRHLQEEEHLPVFVADGSVSGGQALLIGRFETFEQAEATLLKVHRLDGLTDLEVIPSAGARSR